MKKFIPLLIAVALCFAATGCATMSSLTAVDTGTAITSGNFHYVKTVEGTATSTLFLGFGGTNNAGKAVADARAKADLKANQALANVTVVDTQKIILGLVVTIKTTVTADVVEFDR